MMESTDYSEELLSTMIDIDSSIQCYINLSEDLKNDLKVSLPYKSLLLSRWIMNYVLTEFYYDYTRSDEYKILIEDLYINAVTIKCKYNGDNSNIMLKHLDYIYYIYRKYEDEEYNWVELFDKISEIFINNTLVLGSKEYFRFSDQSLIDNFGDLILDSIALSENIWEKIINESHE